MMKRWTLFDFLLVLLAVLSVLSVYFTLVKPIRFSHLIQREGISHYAEIEVLLPDDLSWLKDVVPVGEEFRKVYGNLDWKILGFEEQKLGGRTFVKLRAKLFVTEYSSGILQYGKYTLVPGGKIYLINDDYFIEGRVFKVRILPEEVLL